tara:strand:- start:548 stop:2332 length:1785 start_codon:yes stop_codon:yes gene_type:complete
MKFFSSEEIIESATDAQRKYSDPNFTSQINYLCKDYFAKIKTEIVKNKKKLLKEAIEDHQLELISQKNQIETAFVTFERKIKDFTEGSFYPNKDEEIRKYKCWLGFAALEEKDYRKNYIPEDIVNKKNEKQKEIESLDKEQLNLEDKLLLLKKGEILTEDNSDEISLESINKRLREIYFKKIDLKKAFKNLVELGNEKIIENSKKKSHLEQTIKKFEEENDLYFPEISEVISEYKLEYEFEYSHVVPSSKLSFISEKLDFLEKHFLELKTNGELKRSIVKSSLDKEKSRLDDDFREIKFEIKKNADHLAIIEGNDNNQIKRIYDEYFYDEYEGDLLVNENDLALWEGELNKRKSIINNKQISEILHFTPLKHLSSILEYGVLSNEEISKKNLTSFQVDENRFDARPNFICTSVSYPNSSLLRMKQYKYGPFIIISISPEILLTNVCLFAKSNAATTWYKKPSKYDSFPMLNKNESFLDMFSRDDIRDKNRIPKNFTTDLQAEVLIYKKIPREFIKKIYCESEEIKLNLLEELPDLKERESDFISINPKVFERRIDQDYWESNKNLIKIEDETFENHDQWIEPSDLGLGEDEIPW